MQERVKGPAIGLIVTGGLGALLVLAGLVAQGAMLALYRRMGIPEDQVAQIERMQGANLVISLLMTVLGLAGAGLVILGGFKMLKLRSWVLCVIASFVAMIPCFTSCCCVVGLPIGIWALVVLFNSEVKRAFDAPAA